MHIYDLVKSEARLFKYGSGTGSNFSQIRGRQEKLSGGGTSSGPGRGFLEVFDRAAGATKSGGTTRRAAKMVCLDMDHPEIADFVNWKVREEKKAHALISAGFSSDFNGEAYHTISGQNSNNSIRVTDEFMRAVEAGGTWQTTARTTGKVCDTYEAKDIWHQIADAAWHCADPGVQYDSTINRWHTCPNTARINASNPCSEYMFLDDSACNLASTVNLIRKFLRVTKGATDEGTTRPTAPLDPAAQGSRRSTSRATGTPAASSSSRRRSAGRSVELPDAGRSAKNSHDFRPLGLGYANLGSLLMQMGVPYDSDEGRAIASSLTAIMCGHAHVQDERRDGGEQGRVRRLREEPRADAARDEHAPRTRPTASTATLARPRSTARRARTGTRLTVKLGAKHVATATRRPRCSRRPGRSA